MNDIVKQIRNLREQKDTDKIIKEMNAFKSDLETLKNDIDDLKVTIKTDVANDNFVVNDFVKLAKLFEVRQSMLSQKPDIDAAIVKLQEVSTALGG